MKRSISIFMCAALSACTVGLPKTAIASGVTPDPEPEITQSETEPFSENYLGADFASGEIAYQLKTAIDVSINTFECYIRMEKNEYTQTNKSVIFGNYNYYNAISSNNRYSNFEVDENGNVTVAWTGTKYVFTDVDVRTGEWIHLAVVRDTEAKNLKLYVNAELAQTLNSYPTTDLDGNFFRHMIGSDLRENQRKYPFCGEIGHIACYSSSLSADEVATDFADVTDINCFTRGDLLFSTVLKLGDNKLYDKSIHFNDAYIVTNDLFYDGEFFETGDYSFAVVGDTQRITRLADSSLYSISDWIVNNADEKKIAASFYVGDLTDGNGSMTDEEWAREWALVKDALGKLDGKVPYITTPGNHDYLDDSQYRDLTEYNKYLPYEKFAAYESFGGAYEVGQTQNTYYLMTLGGVPYLFLSLEFGPEAEVMEWACDVLEQYPDRRAVIMTHGFLCQAGELYDDGKYLSAYWYFSRKGGKATSSQDMWDKYLSKYENVFMILCGHSVTDSIAYKQLEGEKGNTVMTFRIDPSYIIAGKGLDSIVSLFTINEATSTLSINYFSATKGKLYNVQNQMQINFKDFTRLSGAYYGKGQVKL